MTKPFNYGDSKKMPHKTILSIFCILFLMLVACSTGTIADSSTGSSTPTADTIEERVLIPITLNDGLNRPVNLPTAAQRVVSLAPSNTEILFAIGAGPLVVGRDEFSNFPEEAVTLPSIGGSFGDYNLEAIVELEPDLILAAEINPPELVQSLEDLGLTVFLVPNPTELSELYEILVSVGQLTGHETEAASLVQSLEKRVSAIEDRVATASQRPTVFYELDASEPNAPWTIGPGTFVNTLISMAGGENVGAAMADSYAQLSVEELVAADPQIILLGDANWGVTPEDIAGRAGWENLAAVKNERIYPFNDDLISRPGPRLVDGLEALAKLLHPEIFE